MKNRFRIFLFSSFFSLILTSAITYSDTYEGVWMNNDSGTIYTIRPHGEGYTLKSAIKEDGRKIEILETAWKNNKLYWTEKNPSSGNTIKASVLRVSGEKMEISCSTQGFSWDYILWIKGGIDQRLNRELKNNVLRYFNGSKAKVKASGVSIAKFEGYNFDNLLYGMSIVNGAVGVINGRPCPVKGSEVLAKMSDPEHTSEDKIFVKGWADGKRGFSSILSVTVADGVRIETTDGNVYVSRNGFWETERSLVKEAQELLSKNGYDIGKVDGIAGLRTKKAVRSFEKVHGIPESGRITEELVNLLKTELEKK